MGQQKNRRTRQKVNANKMITLVKYKLLQKIIGLDPLDGLVNIILRFIFWIFLFSCDLMISIYFILNIHDNKYRAWSAFAAIVAFTSVFATHLYMLICRKRFYALLNELQAIADESKYEKFKKLIPSRRRSQVSNNFD